MAGRADRIFEIIQQAGGHLHWKEVHEKVAEIEEIPAEELNPSTMSATVRADNNTRQNKEQALRFDVHGTGSEARGYISTIERTPIQAYRARILEDYQDQIPKLIEAANERVKESLFKAIRQMSWKEFESSFMRQVLEALGFSSVEVTQPTRDKGIDGRCTYSRGLVQSTALVSAKHWSKNNVGADEVHRMRGKGDIADTAIIFTSSKFSQEAIKDAQPVGAMRAIVLIDGEQIVDTCFDNGIGIEAISLPKLSQFAGFARRDEDSDA